MSECKELEEYLKQFTREWLGGCTCNHHKKSVHWVSRCGNFFIMKHHGHTEYIDRCSPSLWCGTYYALYDRRTVKPGYWAKDETAIRIWEGRWLKEYWNLVDALTYVRD